MEVKRYWRIFKQAAANRFANYAASRLDLVTFIIGKLVRMGFFVLLAISLFNHTSTIAGYSETEILLFFAVMNLVDVLTQTLFYRGTSQLKDWIRRGKFDAFLIQPVSPLFKVVGMQLDLFDLITLPVAIGYLGIVWWLLPTHPDLPAILTATVLFVLSIILALAINIVIAASAFWLQENEAAFTLYRDTIYVARFPPEIFPKGVQAVMTFVIPALMIVAFPSKALLGILSPLFVLIAAAVTVVWSALAIGLWRAGLRHYTSASG